MDTNKFKSLLETIFGEELEAKVEIDAEDIIHVEVAADKISYIIGRHGRNIKAVREIVYLYNKLHNTNYALRLVE